MLEHGVGRVEAFDRDGNERLLGLFPVGERKGVAACSPLSLMTGKKPTYATSARAFGKRVRLPSSPRRVPAVYGPTPGRVCSRLASEGPPSGFAGGSRACRVWSRSSIDAVRRSNWARRVRTT